MPEKVFLLNKHIFTYFNNKIIECRITSISLGTMDEYLYTVVPINNMGREIKLSEGDMYMTKHELVQELLDKRYVYQDLGSIIEEDIYNNEPYFVDKNLINLNGVARYRYTEEKRNLTEYDEYALIELKKSGLKHLIDTRFIFSKDLLENYLDVDNLILVKELVNNVLVFSLLRSINGLEVVIHNRVTKEEIIAYFKQVTEAIATYPIKYVYGDAVHITRVVNSFVNSGLNTKINSNSSIINISVNDNTFAKEVQEQEIVNSTQPGRVLQNYISEKDAIGEEYANNLIGYLKLINSSDYEDISISDGVFIEPVQVLTISIRLNSLEVGDNGNIDITFTLATNDSLPISRTEPLSIDISCLDELNNDSNYFDYDFSIPFTISDFSTNEYTLTLNRDSNKIDENKPVYLIFSTEEEITIENSGFELTILKSEEEPVEPEVPEQTISLSTTISNNKLEEDEGVTITFNIATSDDLPSTRTEPLNISLSYSGSDTNYLDYDFNTPFTITDFTSNVHTITLNRNSIKTDEDVTITLDMSSEVLIENHSYALTIGKTIVTEPEEPEVPVEPEQTLTITVTTTVNEATGELTLGTNIVTSDGLPIKRTEPLVIDIVTKDGDTPIEYFIPSSITILDFTNNVNSFTVERNTDVSVSDDIVVSIEFNSEEGIVIEGTSPTIIIPKDEVVVPEEPQEINVTFEVTKNVAIKEENYEILATVSTSDGKPFQSVGEEQLKVEFIYSDPDSQSHINEVYTLPITKNTSNQSSAVLSIYRNNKISLDNKTFEILISSETPGINVTDGRIELTIVQD